MGLCLNLRMRLLNSRDLSKCCFFFSYVFLFPPLCTSSVLPKGRWWHYSHCCNVSVRCTGVYNRKSKLSYAALRSIFIDFGSHFTWSLVQHLPLTYPVFCFFPIQFQDHLAYCNDSQLLICWLVHRAQSNTILSCS